MTTTPRRAEQSRADPVRVWRTKKTLLGTMLLLCACFCGRCGTGEGFCQGESPSGPLSLHRVWTAHGESEVSESRPQPS